MSTLLIGAGRSRVKQLAMNDDREWHDLVTLDHNVDHSPDVVHDLETLPYPFEDGQFAEIHAYDVLEHVGAQGDWRFFFAQWTEFYRILEPGGLFFGIVPHPSSVWAFGDPSHTRVIPIEQLSFLDQRFYEQVGKTSASDFRHCWHGSFEIVYQDVQQQRQFFALRKVVMV